MILSAYATTGEQWTREQNEQADEELYLELEKSRVWIERLVGYAPETGHAERSWAAELPLDIARGLGRRFQQDAIFHVLSDVLSVTRCDGEHLLVPVGSFRERVDVTDYDTLHPRFSLDPDAPWRLLSGDSARGGHLRPEAAALPLGAQVFEPIGHFWLDQALIEAMPDERSRKLAKEDLEAEGVELEQIAAFLPDFVDSGWVVQCEVTDSMVSGVWGLAEFRIGGKGYLYYRPDSGIGEVPRVVAGWRPGTDSSARRACILSAYARLWHEIGLPPLLGQWVEGDPSILHAAVIAAIKTDQARLLEVVLSVIQAEEGIDFRAPDVVSTLASTFALPSTTFAGVMNELPGRYSRWSRGAAGVSDEELAALVAAYLACIMQRLVIDGS